MKRAVSFRNIITLSAFVLLVSMFNISCTTARRTVGIEEGWEMLGERKVGIVYDKDEIIVDSRNKFTALRFKVEDLDVRVNYLKIHFRSGDILQPSVDFVIPANQNSKTIELGAEGKTIEKIEFKYSTANANFIKGRANVLIFGKKYYPQGY
ncbi:MAG: hypothetical protein JWQ96_1893 [Segetibacter sp.]|nr:hypothetical protein [Segetibacter sp.]